MLEEEETTAMEPSDNLEGKMPEQIPTISHKASNELKPPKAVTASKSKQSNKSKGKKVTKK